MKKWSPQDSASQRLYTQPITLATFGGVVAGGGTIVFEIPTPDSRLRTKVSLLFVQPAGTFSNTGLANTSSLWLAEADQELSGVFGGLINCTNIEGTRAAATTIPAADGLQGYSREFVTSGDFIRGEFAAATASPILRGSWVLQTRYQPDSVRFSPPEWDELASMCQPKLIGSPLVLG